MNMSLRGTAVFALGMLAHNRELTVQLKSVGWAVKRIQPNRFGCVCTPVASKDFFLVPESQDDEFRAKGVVPRSQSGIFDGSDGVGSAADQGDRIPMPEKSDQDSDGIQGVIERAVQNAIDTAARESAEKSSMNPEPFNRALELCIMALGNNISAGKARPLLGLLRTELEEMINTNET